MYAQTIVWVLVLLLCTVSSQRLNRDNIRLVSNVYQGLVVSIKPRCDGEFAPAEAQTMIDNLKFYLKQASRELFTATKHRAYLGEVTIDVPDDFPDVTGVEYSSTGSNGEGNMVIDQLNPRYNHRPYVVQPNGCGQPAQYLHLTWDFLLNRTLAEQYGPIGKTFLHELGHLLWGLLDEYLEDQDYSENLQTSDIACPETLEGKWESTTHNRNCREGDRCKFVPRNPQEDELEDSQQMNMATIMGYHHVEEVSQFCDSDASDPDTRHNSYADTMHNRQCSDLAGFTETPSAWDIMEQHVDFSDDNSPVNSPETIDTDPTFVISRQTTQRIVLVLDVSGSMHGDKIMRQKTGADFLVASAIKGCHDIGVVQFSTRASAVQDITSIATDDDVTMIQNRIPAVAGGNTCIGCGINTALEMLGPNMGGTIIVLSDGDENESPLINTTTSQVQAQQVTVDSILFDAVDGTHPLVTLSQATGGSILHATGDSILEVDFFNLLTKRTCDSSANAKHISTVLHKTVALIANDSRTYRPYVDSTITDDMKIILKAQAPLTSTTLQIYSPDMTSPDLTPDLTQGLEGDLNSASINVEINDRFGEWRVRLENGGNEANTYDVLITGAGTTRSCDDLPITITPMYDALVDFSDFDINNDIIQHGMYCRVSRRTSTVTGAEVTATLHWTDQSDGSQSEEIYAFLDDGIDPDSQANDGIYSARLMFRGNYIYYITFDVALGVGDDSTGGGGGVLNLPRLRGEPDPGPIPTVQPQVNPFRRIQDGGFIQIVNQPPGTEDRDWYPPSRVSDLREGTTQDGATALVFTAVGEDYVQGAAQSYDIRVSSISTANIYENFTSAMSLVDLGQISETDLDNLTSGIQAGRVITIPLQQRLLDHDQLFYYALRAIDISNNTGRISNPVRIRFPGRSSSNSLDPAILAAIILTPICVLLLVGGAFFMHWWCNRPVSKARDLPTMHDVYPAHLQAMNNPTYNTYPHPYGYYIPTGAYAGSSAYPAPSAVYGSHGVYGGYSSAHTSRSSARNMYLPRY